MSPRLCAALALFAVSTIVVPAAPAQVVVQKRPASGSTSTPAQDPEGPHYTRGVKFKAPTPAAGPTTVPAPAGATASAVTWEPFVGMDAQVFPSFVVATATLRLPQEDKEEDDPRSLGEGMGFIGVALTNVPAGSRLKVEIKSNAIMDASVFDGRASDGPGDYEIYPKLNYKFDALVGWRQPMPMNVVMEVFVDGQSVGTRSQTVTVRSINDCPFAILADEDSEDDDLDLSWMFAAYVNENHPWVDTLTREALESKVVDAFSAYQGDSEEEVLRQVYAIWHTLQKRGIRYSDISQSSAESDVVLSQHVRLFDETVNAHQANCVDGTVMIAAVLRKIGIEPYLVVLPGHMFLAFDLDAEGNRTFGLETTMMGSTDPGTAASSRRVPPSMATRYRALPSLRSFSAAIDAGTQQLNENRAKFDGDDPDYQVISLTESRKMGILPLAYRPK